MLACEDLPLSSNDSIGLDLMCLIAIKSKDAIAQAKDLLDRIVRLRELKQIMAYRKTFQTDEPLGEVRLVLSQLTCRIGAVKPSIQKQVKAISLWELKILAKALVEFSKEDDLVKWLYMNSVP